MITPSNLFQHTIQVTSADIDELGHVNNVVYVRYIQEVAAAHWNAAASAELKAKYVWVVLRHEIDYKTPAFLNEEILGQTWVSEYHGARSVRVVKLISAATQKIVVEAKTTWCMLDAITKRPARIQDDVSDVIQKYSAHH